MNNVKRLLENDKPVIGSFAKMPSPSAAEILSLSGFDYVVVDLEPGAINIETAENMVRAIKMAGGCPIIRVQENSFKLIVQALELGAMGIHVPNVDTKEDAMMAVAATRFPPRGDRPVNGALRAVRLGKDYEALDKETMLIVHIESEQSVKNISQIASVPGIDVAYVGPNDLSQSLGIPGHLTDPVLDGLYEEVISKLKGTGVCGGMYLVEPARADAFVKMGYRYLAYASDISFLSTMAKKHMQSFAPVTAER